MINYNIKLNLAWYFSVQSEIAYYMNTLIHLRMQLTKWINTLLRIQFIIITFEHNHLSLYKHLSD